MEVGCGACPILIFAFNGTEKGCMKLKELACLIIDRAL